MRILFIAPIYLNLYLPIKEEMESLGHTVFFLEDKLLPDDPKKIDVDRIERFRRFIRRKLHKPFEKYAEGLFQSVPELKEPFDILFCIQGISLSQYFINKLKEINPQMKSVLYVWDSNLFMNYFENVPLFDKAYSFDYEDCQKKRVEFFPFYWQECKKEDERYDVSCIGTEHDGRYRIITKIIPQLKNAGLKYYIKIKTGNAPVAPVFRKRTRIIVPWLVKKLQNDYNIQLTQYNELFNSEVYMKDFMPAVEVERIISQTRCVLDTDRECQTGTTPRVIWALACGKKIISTNTSLKKLPFYNPQQIRIIDRKSPKIDIDFIKDKTSFPVHPLIEKLRIDRWVQHILQF